MSYLYVMIGGALGAGLRFGAGQFVKGTALPAFAGTFAVNILGSFLIGIAFALLVVGRDAPSPLAPLLITGFLGGFTTFSAFSLEMMQFISTGRIAWALLYAIASVVLGLLACYLGMMIAR